jgi:hypothetical protein
MRVRFRRVFEEIILHALVRFEFAMIRVFPKRNFWTPDDELAFIGERSMFSPQDRTMPVRISATFTWDKDEAERIADSWAAFYSDVQVGGPAYNSPAGEFVPGRFMKRGCTITTRGCPKKCPWCVVPKREGHLIELAIQPGWILQDNNILAASRGHIERVFDMLRAQNRNIYFTGGLDKHFLEPWHVELFKSIKVGELWFACDLRNDVQHLRAAREMLGPAFKERQLRCYTMIGFKGQSPDAMKEDLDRIKAVYALGFLPFCQLFQPMERKRIEYSNDWKAAQKYWSRPAIYRSKSNTSDEVVRGAQADKHTKEKST